MLLLLQQQLNMHTLPEPVHCISSVTPWLDIREDSYCLEFLQIYGKNGYLPLFKRLFN
jgi:hypothetical protein